MNRRNFLTGCAATAAGAVVASTAVPAAAASDGKVSFADAPLKMSIPHGWFPGKELDEKFAGVASYGFPAYEWLGPNGDIDALKVSMDRANLKLSCIGGAGAIAPRQMVDPTDHDRVVAQFQERVQLAHKLGCNTLIGLTGNERDDVSRDEQTANVVTCLKRLAPIAEQENVTIVMEALNVLVNHKGYFMVTTAHTMEILQAVNSPNVKMCYDIYHQQISEGNLIKNITDNIDRIGHFHVGDNPGRKQPGTGEINYKNVFKAIAETKYQGYVALECGCEGDLDDALRYLREYCLTWT
ncbi:MAG TPA: TIM barrel protein [Candidatus Hydrogenedentes bacterium]|nr:TIM barrel protein [Candidatus Hydrogenedentota bacterium]HPG66340.1 TIM barrel protein [Candidatus Hydrogenedentota bacterium]